MISGRLTTDVDHEAAVAEFFAGKLAEEPERTQAVFARHPIQTDERLDKIQRREVDVEALAGILAVDIDGQPLWTAGIDAAEDLISRQRRIWAKDPERSRPLTDTERLRAFLADGAKPATEVAALMTDYRLRKAKASLSVLTKRVGFGRNSVVMWELPIPVETGPPNGVLVEAPRAVHSFLPSSKPRAV